MLGYAAVASSRHLPILGVLANTLGALITMFLYYKNVYVRIELIEWKSGVRSRTRMGPSTSVEPRQRTHKGQLGGYRAYYGHPSHLSTIGWHPNLKIEHLTDHRATTSD